MFNEKYIEHSEHIEKGWIVKKWQQEKIVNLNELNDKCSIESKDT